MIFQLAALFVSTLEICTAMIKQIGYELYYIRLCLNTETKFKDSCNIKKDNHCGLFIFRQGQDFGDEYFAELDMIEVVEMRKEGYESDVDEGKCPKTYNLWFEKKIT